MCFFMLSAEWLPLVISAVLPVQSLRFFSVLEFEFHLILVGGGGGEKEEERKQNGFI